MKKLLAKIRKILRDRRTRRFLTRFVSGAAAIVVFVTTYALVLPAITMEKEANCGMEAHQHDDSCYTEELICDIPESDAHHHDENCYSTKRNLICEITEHEHSPENGCYDEDGNLTCDINEHQHNDECYEEVRDLICEIPESDGHRHTDECYEKVLTCGKETHVHSTSCYEDDPISHAAVAASTGSAAAAGTSAGSVSSAGMTLLFDDKPEPVEENSDPSMDNETPAGDVDPADNDAETETDNKDAADNNEAADNNDQADNNDAADNHDITGTGSTEAANTALTNAGNSSTAAAGAAAADQYIPPLDPIDFNTVLNKRTGIYYHPVADGETVEDSYALPAEDWNPIPNNTDRNTDHADIADYNTENYTDSIDNTDTSDQTDAANENKENKKINVELGKNDLLRVYLSYTIPAGSLNATNPVARYRLPSNLHLTDSQVKDINENINGMAEQYVDMSNLEITDPDKYNAYLGLEAVEGTRTPDETVEDYLADQLLRTGTDAAGADAADAAEYISAVVRVENVYDTDGIYGEKDAFLGQDLIFTFSPYSIQKNQHEYDSTGKPTKAGKEIEGWFTIDLNMGQVDWSEPERTTSTVAASVTDNDAEPVDDRGEDNQNQAVTVERAERTAEIIFVEESWDEKGNVINQISTTLTVVEETVVEAQNADQDDDQEADNEETIAETATENAEEAGTAGTEETSEPAAEDESAVEKEDSDKNTDQAGKGDAAQTAEDSATVVVMPAMSFFDSIKVTTGRPAGIDENAGGTLANAADALPKKAEVSVRVEADEGTFPAGTTMILKAINKKDMAALSETVADTVEKGSADSAKDPVANTEDKQEDKNNLQNADSNANTNIKTYGFQAVDITFLDKDGNEIEPAKPVRVALTSEVVEQVREEAKESLIADPVIVHVDDEGNAEQMDLVNPEEIEPAKGRSEEELLEEAEKSPSKDARETSDTADAADEVQENKKDKEDNDIPEDSAIGEMASEASKDNASSDVIEDNDVSTTGDVPVSDDNKTTTDTAVDTHTDDEAENGAYNDSAVGNDTDTTDADSQLNTDEEAKDTAADATTVGFTADSFSVYAIVYTVELYTNVITDSGETYRISVTYDETSGIPQDAKLRVSEIKEGDAGYDKYYEEAVKTASDSLNAQIGQKQKDETDSLKSNSSDNSANDTDFAKITENKEGEGVDTEKDKTKKSGSTYARFFDIEIWHGVEKIEPTGDVLVDIRLLDAPEKTEAMPKVVHFGTDGPSLMNINEKKADGSEEESEAIVLQFATNEFSVYSVIYTVDFHFEIDGKSYSFSIPGGGYVSLSSIVELLGIAKEPVVSESSESTGDSDVTIDNADTQNVADIEDGQNVTGSENTENGETNTDSNDVNDTNVVETTPVLTLEDLEISEETRQFIENVANVSFSKPELVWVGKVEDTTTVGALKESFRLECEKSANLTDEQMATINGQTVNAGEWVLISLKPFDTEETLTVTMVNGDVVEIRVTDAQENPYGLGGKSFVVVNYKKTTTYDLIGHSWNGSYAENTYRWVIHNASPYYVLGNQGAFISTYSYNNQPKWTFKYLDKDRQFLIKDQNDNYLYIDSNQLNTTIDEDTAKEHPFIATIDYEINNTHPFTRDAYSTTNYDRKTHTEREYIFTNIEGTLALARTGNGSSFGVAIVNYDSATQWFALVSNDGIPGEIATADNNEDNIKVTLFDYGPETLDYKDSEWQNNNTQSDGKMGAMPSGYNVGINNGHGLKFQSHGTDYSDDYHISINSFSTNGYPGNSTTNVGYRSVQGIVKSELSENGYPILAPPVFNNESLEYLFDPNDIIENNTSYKKVYKNVNHLFIKDEMGYYRYDSNQNYAYYDKSQGDSGNFKVYASTFNEEGTGEQEGIGFFPFNDYDSYYNCIHGKGDDFKGWAPHSDQNDTTQKAKTGHYNHHFGMMLETDFIMTPDGKYLGKDISFDFSGDDDLWVFVDGVLVLDIGGIHSPVGGNINFNTGEVTVGSREAGHESDSDSQLTVKYGDSFTGQPGPTSIKKAFERVSGKEWDDSPYIKHTLKVFYLERGGMYSNLAISFNLPTYKTITVEKELKGLTEEQLARYNDEYYYYQVNINDEPFDDIYGVLTRPATKAEMADWERETKIVNGEEVYIGGHWKEGTNHTNTETINKNGELVKWHIAVKNGIVRVKPGWYFTIEELTRNDKFSVKELYGYDESFEFNDGQPDTPQTTDLMKPFFAPTAEYRYKDANGELHKEALPLTENVNVVDDSKTWSSSTKPLQYSDRVKFINTLPTGLHVEKVWTDEGEEGVDHSEDEIEYKIFRTPYRIVDNPDPEAEEKTIRINYPVEELVKSSQDANPANGKVYVQSMQGYTGTLKYIEDPDTHVEDSANSWKETVTWLPRVGKYTYTDSGQQVTVDVLYEYFITETSVPGYKYTIEGGEITGDGEGTGDGQETGDGEGTGDGQETGDGEGTGDGQETGDGEETDGTPYGDYSYTIKNEPLSPTDRLTEIDIQKEWRNADGSIADTDLHKDDSIIFKVAQYKYEAKASYSYNGETITSKLYPIIIDLVDKNGINTGDRKHYTTVVYVPEGSTFTIDPHYDPNDSHNNRHMITMSGIDPDGSTYDTYTWTNTHGPSSTYYYPDVKFKIDNVDSAKEVTLWLYSGNDYWDYLYDTNHPQTNLLNKDDLTGLANTPRQYHWTCELSCDRDIIWDLDEMVDKVLSGAAADLDEPVSENWTPPEPVNTYPHYHQYGMRLVTGEEGLETEIENLKNGNVVAPGSGVGYVVGDDSIWKGSIKELLHYEFNENKYDENGELIEGTGIPYIYKYEVTEAQIGTEVLDISPVYGTEEPTPILYNGQTSQYLVKWEKQSDGTVKFTNKKKETVDISADKSWVDPSGVSMDPLNGATVTFELFADGVATGKTVVLNGTTVADQIATIQANEELTEEEQDAAIAQLEALTFGELTTAWKAEWKDLPEYKYEVKEEASDDTPADNEGEPEEGEPGEGEPEEEAEEEPIKEPIPIVYTVKETVTYPGFENLNPDGVSDGGTITNKQLVYSIKIVKVDANNTETGLSGAKFQMMRKLSGESVFTKFEHDSFEVEAGNANKKTGLFTVTSTDGIILAGLLPGEYQIEEKVAPDGYNIILQPFTFTLGTDGSITNLIANNELVVPFQKIDDNPAGLQIGNTPGAELPASGGPGTRLIYLLGGMLMLGTGLLLLHHRKRMRL